MLLCYFQIVCNADTQYHWELCSLFSLCIGAMSTVYSSLCIAVCLCLWLKLLSLHILHCDVVVQTYQKHIYHVNLWDSNTYSILHDILLTVHYVNGGSLDCLFIGTIDPTIINFCLCSTRFNEFFGFEPSIWHHHWLFFEWNTIPNHWTSFFVDNFPIYNY